MRTIRLSPRLLAVAELVYNGARVIDVGTDHALVPVWLVQTGRASHVWASDLRQGPLDSALRLVTETGTGSRIDLRLTNGLHGFGPEDADTVIIAGMGGETMVAILSEAAWVRNVRLILEPQSKQATLRRWLAENGYTAETERLVADAGRLYPVLTVLAGSSPPYTEAEYHTGLWTLIRDDPLLGKYLDQLMRRTASAAPYDPSAEALLDDFRHMKERLNS